MDIDQDDLWTGTAIGSRSHEHYLIFLVNTWRCKKSQLSAVCMIQDHFPWLLWLFKNNIFPWHFPDFPDNTNSLTLSSFPWPEGTLLIILVRNNVFNKIWQSPQEFIGVKVYKTSVKFVQIWHFYCTMSRGSAVFTRHSVHILHHYHYHRLTACHRRTVKTGHNAIQKPEEPR